MSIVFKTLGFNRISGPLAINTVAPSHYSKRDRSVKSGTGQLTSWRKHFVQNRRNGSNETLGLLIASAVSFLVDEHRPQGILKRFSAIPPLLGSRLRNPRAFFEMRLKPVPPFSNSVIVSCIVNELLFSRK